MCERRCTARMRQRILPTGVTVRSLRATCCCAAALALGGCYASHERLALRADGGTRARDAGPDEVVEFTITDSLGWSLAMSYHTAPRHLVSSEAELPYPVDCPEGQLPYGGIDVNGRVLVVMAGCYNRIYEIMVRPVVCAEDADCEPVLAWLRASHAEGVPAGTECLDGLCQFPRQPIIRQDSYALCLYDTPRWRNFDTARSDASGYYALRPLIESNCEIHTCTVPDSCHPL